MDAVFNHSAEGNENGPILSFRGVDNSVFYMLAPKVCVSINFVCRLFSDFNAHKKTFVSLPW